VIFFLGAQLFISIVGSRRSQKPITADKSAFNRKRVHAIRLDAPQNVSKILHKV